MLKNLAFILCPELQGQEESFKTMQKYTASIQKVWCDNLSDLKDGTKPKRDAAISAINQIIMHKS